MTSNSKRKHFFEFSYYACQRERDMKAITINFPSQMLADFALKGVLY